MLLPGFFFFFESFVLIGSFLEMPGVPRLTSSSAVDRWIGTPGPHFSIKPGEPDFALRKLSYTLVFEVFNWPVSETNSPLSSLEE